MIDSVLIKLEAMKALFSCVNCVMVASSLARDGVNERRKVVHSGVQTRKAGKESQVSGNIIKQ